MIDALWVVHPDPDAGAAFERRFAGLPNFRAVVGRFEDLEPHDCFVTAGNSFGIMNAGIDAAVVRFFGTRIMRGVQYRVMSDYVGEQPVGTAFIIPTDHPRRPFLCHAPTMRVPGSIDGTANVYTATWAAFLAVHAHNQASAEKIGTVVFPAMGTGFGGVSFDEAARQMAAAYRHLLSPPRRLDWDFVIDRQKSLLYDNGNRVL